MAGTSVRSTQVRDRTLAAALEQLHHGDRTPAAALEQLHHETLLVSDFVQGPPCLRSGPDRDQRRSQWRRPMHCDQLDVPLGSPLSPTISRSRFTSSASGCGEAILQTDLENSPTLCLGDMCSTQRRDPVPPGQMLCQSLGEDAFIAATPNFGTRVAGSAGRPPVWASPVSRSNSSQLEKLNPSAELLRFLAAPGWRKATTTASSRPEDPTPVRSVGRYR